MKYNIKSTGENIVADIDFMNLNYPKDFIEVQPTETPTNSPRTLTHLQYMSLFKPEELRAIYTTAKSIIDVEIWLDKFKMAGDISKDDPDTLAGLLAMESVGLIAVGRAAEILA